MFYLDGNSNSDGSPTYTTDPTVTKIEMFINNIFVNPEVHDIFIKRIGFSLIRVHREQKQTIQTSTGDVLLNQMKWPIETLYVGFRRASYQTASSSNDKWHTFHGYNSSNTYRLHGVGTATSADNSTFSLVTTNSTGDQVHAVAVTPLRMVDELTISAHGIPLYNAIKAQFFDSYMPYLYGGSNVNTPDTAGALMINFCIYPGTYQPSSHINVSRAREFYLKYTGAFDADGSTDLISSANPAQLYLLGVAINFLLITDGLKAGPSHL